MRLSVQRSELGEYRRRYQLLVLGIMAAFLVLSARLVQLQVAEAPVHKAQARRNIVGRVTLATTRGVIRDSTGSVLAANRPSYDIYIVPGQLNLTEDWPLVASLMKLSPSQEREIFDKIVGINARQDKRSLQQLLIQVDAERDVVAALETQAAQLRGVDVVPTPVRYYPNGKVGSHLLGYMREIDAEGLARREGQGYRPGDRLGAVGIERRWESYLRGQRGWKKVVRGANRRARQTGRGEHLLGEPRRLEPIPGRDITLTIDVELQRLIEHEMRTQLAGAVVVVDVKTGRLLGAMSKPSFDPNVLSGEGGREAIRDAFRLLMKDSLKPLIDKTTSAAYPPGSTYKPFAALAALGEGLVDPQTKVDCRGGYEYGKRFFRCTSVHRRVNLHDALVQSCNTYFYSLGDLIHIDRLAAVGRDFGFGMRTGLGVNPESKGRMPTRAWYSRRYKREGFRGGFTLLAAIGQGATSVTVLQLALAYAALANDGTLYQPQVVRSIETSDGTQVQQFPPRVRRVIESDPSSVKLVKKALVGVVSSPSGTAYQRSLSGQVDMAGKTGTAQVSHVKPSSGEAKDTWYFNRDHAWFAGYAPAHDPQIAIVVLVEHGGGGGKNAAPIAMKVVDGYRRLRARRGGDTRSRVASGTIP